MKIIVHHYHHFDEGNDKLGEILKQILINTQKLDQIMATQAEFTEALAKIDAATTKAGTAIVAIGERITGLEDAIKNAGLPADVEAALLAQVQGVGGNLETLATTLETMGKKPTDPVPDPIPDPLPPVEG